MSRVPIIHRQRALSQVGEIRIGGEKGANQPGRKLESFRLTSQHKEIIETAATLYGGTVEPWASPNGEAWQLYTTTNALPCMVIVGYSLTRMYEAWEGATKCVRRCDGIEEQLTGAVCLCNANGDDKCDTITRLMVMLPETGTSLGWKLRSTGEFAADELDGAMMVAEKIAAGRPFVPATLRLTHRRSTSGGQTKKFVVPVLDFNLVAEIQAAAVPQLPNGYKPIAAELPAGVTVEAGLEAAAAKSTARTSRSAAPIPVVDDIPFGDEPVPVPDETGVVRDNGDGSTTQTVGAGPKATAAQLRKLNVLVGKLREAGHVTTEQMYAAVARMRNLDHDELVAATPDARYADGGLHWGPLRDTLTKEEAMSLIDRLERLQAKIATAATT